MLKFLDALRRAPIPAREHAAFIAALAVTLGIGAAWFSFSFGAPSEQTERIVKQDITIQDAASAVDATEGPLARLRAEVADAAVSIAAQVGTIANLWKSYLFPPPLQFERQDE